MTERWSDPAEARDPRAMPSDDVARDLRPTVAAKATGGGLWLTVGGAVLLGLLVFVFLASRRDAALPAPGTSVPAGQAATVTPPPPVPPELALAEAAGRSTGYAPLPGPAFAPPPLTSAYLPTPPAPVFVQGAAVAPAPTGPSAAQRRAAPTLIVDLGGPAPAAVAAAPPTGTGAGVASGTTGSPLGNPVAGGGIVGAVAAAGGAAAGAAGEPGQASTLNADEQFADRVGSSEPERVRATMLRNPGAVVPQGALIPGVLETALNSDLPGFARAVVSRDVRSFDGTTVLIPRGSRVIGQYRSAVALGQSRAFIIWTRLIRPDGASIQLGSSGTDPLGRTGLEGRVDRHFFQRFGGAILLSVLNAGVAAIGEQPSTQVVIGSSTQATGLASVVTPTDIPPTIKVAQGSPIRIFVARDLDFSPVQGAAR